MRQKSLKHIARGAFIGSLPLVCLWFTHTQTPPQVKPTKHPAVSEKRTTGGRLQSSPARMQDALKHFQTSEFYRAIVDNNLFRPLGWRPPRKREPYRLIGTLIPTDANTPSQAIVQRTTAGSTFTVTLGDNLDADTTLIDIQPKQVTLEKAGGLRTLKLNTTPLIK